MIYLDHAATTPVSPEVAQTMVEALTKGYGNPSAQYALGREAKALTDRARGSVAGALGARPEQLFFTSCGTEGDNWAIRAALHQNRRVGKHIVTTAVEHSAVLQCVKQLEREGYTADCVKPDGEGRISAEAVLNDGASSEAALMDTLRAGSYRPELRNVLNYTPLGELLDTSVKGASDIAQLYLVQDNEVVATASFYNDYSHTVQVSVKGNPNTFFYHTDGAVYDALSALMMEYGVLK